MSVCTCIAQDRVHLMQVLSRRPIVYCPSEHWLVFGAPLWGVALLIGMADSASSAEESPDDDSDLCRTHTATGRKKSPDDDSNLDVRAQLPDTGSTVKARLPHTATELLRHIPFFSSSSYYTCTFPYTSSAYWKYIHTFCVSLICYYSSFKIINCYMVEVQGMSLCIAYA